VNTVRFINQYTTGYGNYTEERRELFADQTLADLIDEIKQRRTRREEQQFVKTETSAGV
jgi:hypothetical protein